MPTLSEYLKQRGLYLDPTKVDEDIFDNEDLTKEVSEIWQMNGNAIRSVIQARINAIGKYILEKAVPEEVIVNRQAIVELGALVTDFEKALAEQKRRDNKGKQTTEAEAPPVKKGEEGSL